MQKNADKVALHLTGEALPRVIEDQPGLSCEFTTGKDDKLKVDCELNDSGKDEIIVSNDLVKQALMEEEKKLDVSSIEIKGLTPDIGTETDDEDALIVL